METWKLMAITLLVVGIAGVTATYALIATVGTQDMFSVTFYDKNKNPIGRGLSIVDGESGVFYVKFQTRMRNTGELPLTMELIDANPRELETAYSGIEPVELGPGEREMWESEFINITKFEGQTVTFGVEVEGEYTYQGETSSMTKTAEMDLTIEPETGPRVGFDVDINYTSGKDEGGGGNPDSPDCWSKGADCDPEDHNCCNTCESTGAEKRELVKEKSVSAGKQCGLYCPNGQEYSYCWYSWGFKPGYNYIDWAKVSPGNDYGISGNSPIVCKMEGVNKEATYQCT